MLRKLISVFVVSAAVLCVQITALPATQASAVEIGRGVCNSGNAQNKNPEFCNDRSPNDSPLVGDNGIITSAIRVVSTLIGIVAVIVMIIAGIKYMTANGDSNGVSQARNAIIFAAVGLAIAVTARAIVELVLTRLV